MLSPGERLATKIRVRPLEPDDSLAHLTGMLHRAYKQHADRGIKALAAFQPEELTRRRIAGGECTVALYMGKIVGTILFRGPGQLGGTPWFERPDVATFSQFAVEPEYQGRGIGSVLMSLVENRARETGAVEGVQFEHVPGAGGTVSITRRIGRWRTAYLVLSGRSIDAETALRWGLVDEIG